MNNMLWLLRREVWEHRSLWIAPLVIAGVILVAAAFGGINVGDNDHIWVGSGNTDVEDLSVEDREKILGAMAAAGLEKKQLIYAFTLSMFTAVQLAVMVIVLFFYLLDSLMTERKDRSILFWKSLPVSDSQVVLSKLFTAVVVVPLFVLLVSSALQVLFAFVWSIRFSGTLLGDTLMAWHGATWLKLQAAFLTFVAAATVWYLPLVAYLLLVSVWARRNAFLWAVLPPVSILAIEGLILRSNQFGEFLGRRLSGVFEITGKAFGGIHNNGLPTMGEALSSIAAVFTSYETWLGVLAGAAMIFATIRVRRLRDDS